MASPLLSGGASIAGGALPWWANVNSALGKNSNLLLGLGAGLLSGNLSEVPQAIAQGSQADTAYAASKKADLERQQSINKTMQAMQAKYPDLAAAVNGGLPIADAYNEMFKRMAPGYGHKYMSVGNGQVFDEASGKYVDMPGGGNAPPFDGTSMDAQVGNILMQGDPASPEYAYAYSIASQPKITMQQTPNGLVPVYQTPDLSTVRRPTFQLGGGAAASPPAPVSPGPLVGSDGGLSPAIGAPTGVSVGTAIPGTKAAATESQARYGMLSNALTTDLPAVLGGYDALANPKAQALAIGGKLTNWAQSADYQKASAALKASVGNIVYAISGANSTPQEQQRKIDEVTPQIGDKPATIAFKKQQLIAYVRGIAQASNDPEQKAKAEAVLQALTAAQSPIVDLGNGITIQEVPE